MSPATLRALTELRAALKDMDEDGDAIDDNRRVAALMVTANALAQQLEWESSMTERWARLLTKQRELPADHPWKPGLTLVKGGGDGAA